MPAWPVPRDEAEFAHLMQVVDQELTAGGVLIHARPMHALTLISQRLGLTFRLAPVDAPAVPGNYQGDSLVAHVHAWYERMYGDRLRTFAGPGSTIVMVRGNPWRIVYPTLYGTFLFTSAPRSRFAAQAASVDTPSGASVANVLNSIRDFPDGLAESLSQDELDHITRSFVFGLETLHALGRVHFQTLVRESLDDLEVAVSSFFTTPPQYHTSKWSSQQFVEKLLKAFLTAVGADVPKTHDLEMLASLCERSGLLGIVPRYALEQAACSPDVRYDAARVDLDAAYRAHEFSLEVALMMAMNLEKQQ